jgi:FADH2 O2-dependent halogenase
MQPVDVIILGGGFGGSIMAMILRRLGRSVAVLERGCHPRFAIGESSTPLTNLLLEELAARYGLPDLATFSKWGAWQAAHPEMACGLKRGFTFYKHTAGREIDFTDRGQQLLVAASPNDRIADTHWYRPQFDHHLAKQAAALGAHVFEQADFQLENTDDRWRARGTSSRGEIDLEAKFVIDATGPRGCLWKHFALGEAAEGFLAEGFPRTQALFAHFKNVARLDPPAAGAPYPVDDAALHHVFEGGWIWVLRFNNGITSAGVVAEPAIADELRLSEKAPAWNRLLERFPTIRAQFAQAKLATPYIYQPAVPFRSPKAVGLNWALLPSAAGFVDPLFSTGFVLMLLGIERLARQFAVNLESDLAEYEAVTFSELDQAGSLVRAAYRSFGDFARFAEISRFYFASAIWSETLRRLGRTPPNFLFSNRPAFRAAVRALAAGGKLSIDLQPYDLAGLTDATRQNWHPALASDLHANAAKIPATPQEIESMLKRCGF